MSKYICSNAKKCKRAKICSHGIPHNRFTVGIFCDEPCNHLEGKQGGHCIPIKPSLTDRLIKWILSTVKQSKFSHVNCKGA